MREAFKENLETIESDRPEGVVSILYSTEWVEQRLGVEHDTYHDTDREEPELQPFIVAGRPAAEQVEAWRRAHRHQQIRRKCVRLVTTQLRQICGDAPFEVLRDPSTGFTRVTPRQMFNHLFAHHAPVTPDVKTSVDDRLKEQFDMADPAPFETKVKHMQECQLLSLDFPNPITPEKLTEELADCFGRAQIRPQRWLEWENKPTSAKTWPNTMSFFRTGFDEYKALANIAGETTPTINNIDASSDGDSTIDSMVTREELANVLDNLACAVTSGQSNEALDPRFDDLLTLVKKIDGRLVKMEKTLLELRSGGVGSGGGGSNDTKRDYDRQQRENDRQHSTRYCWSHGYAVGPGHDSSTCSKKKEGHKDNDATRANPMGGSTYGAGFGKKPNGSEAELDAEEEAKSTTPATTVTPRYHLRPRPGGINSMLSEATDRACRVIRGEAPLAQPEERVEAPRQRTARFSDDTAFPKKTTRRIKRQRRTQAEAEGEQKRALDHRRRLVTRQ